MLSAGFLSRSHPAQRPLDDVLFLVFFFHEILDVFARHGERDAFHADALQSDDAQHHPLRVEERSAGIAVIHRRGRLNHVRDPDRPAGIGNDSRRDRVRHQFVLHAGIADGVDFFAGVRSFNAQMRDGVFAVRADAVGRGRQLNQRQVAARIDGDDFRALEIRLFARIPHLHLDVEFRTALNDVVIGRGESVARQDEARAGAQIRADHDHGFLRARNDLRGIFLNLLQLDDVLGALKGLVGLYVILFNDFNRVALFGGIVAMIDHVVFEL